MVFANLVFLYLFLPLNILLYFLSKNIVYRNIVLVCFSMFFYAWGEPVWFVLLFCSAALDYMHGRLIERFRGTWLARLSLILSLGLNLSLLGMFKYSGFFVENINALLGTAMPVPSFALPIGISFYTFQTITYVVDVYRGQAEAQKNPLYYLLYLSMYPQLVAGPIIRYVDVAREIQCRTTSMAGFSEGLTRMLFGLGKKVLLANTAGQIAAGFMDTNPASLTIGGAWLGAILYSFQIYYDFSGYSDMAVGLARIFGFHYKENFNYPYTSQSVTEFWRRWHISLSSFFRDYVYIPLGGNRKHQYVNLAIVWFLTGFWHGASWNFILWGVFYGVLIAVERLGWGKLLAKMPRVLRHLYLLFIVVIGWVIFYFTDLSKMGSYLGAMFGLGGQKFWNMHLQVSLFNNIFWLILAVAFCMPLVKIVKSFVSERLSATNISLLLGYQTVLNLFLLITCTAQLVGQSFNPFLYYRF